MGTLMAYPKGSGRPRRGGLYDTPTDGISKKVFDRYKDAQVTKYVRTQERVRELEIRIRRLEGSEE